MGKFFPNTGVPIYLSNKKKMQQSNLATLSNFNLKIIYLRKP